MHGVLEKRTLKRNHFFCSNEQKVWIQKIMLAHVTCKLDASVYWAAASNLYDIST